MSLAKVFMFVSNNSYLRYFLTICITAIFSIVIYSVGTIIFDVIHYKTLQYMIFSVMYAYFITVMIMSYLAHATESYED